VIADGRVRAYLERLGFGSPTTPMSPPPPTIEGLRRLHAAHLERVPFENLSIHLGEPIVLEPEALVAKLVDQRRGGFCYELNGAFATLLRALGFEVTLLAARVHEGDALGPPFDHICLLVELEERWLADVGFGDNFRLPLRLDRRDDQVDDAGTFRIVDAGPAELDLLRDGQPQYRFDLTPRELPDYEPTCRYHQTSPESHFTHNTVCSLATPTGRVTIRGRTMIVTNDRHREEHTLTDSELLDAYSRHFGIELTRLPPTHH
jgi:N-hydroxyarylamine O-acetyltransferase